MKTQINGKDAEWTDAIQSKWDNALTTAPGDQRPVIQANYFTPRPYVDAYNSGSREEGFTYTRRGSSYAGDSVFQVIIRKHDRVGGDDINGNTVGRVSVSDD